MVSTEAYEKQLLELRQEYTQRRDAIHRDTHHEEQPVEKDFAEQVSQRETEDVLDALDEEARQIVIQIDNALQRIRAGEYGVCQNCGEDIPEARLQVVPWAEYCIQCAEDRARKP